MIKHKLYYRLTKKSFSAELKSSANYTIFGSQGIFEFSTFIYLLPSSQNFSEKCLLCSLYQPS